MRFYYLQLLLIHMFYRQKNVSWPNEFIRFYRIQVRKMNIGNIHEECFLSSYKAEQIFLLKNFISYSKPMYCDVLYLYNRVLIHNIFDKFYHEFDSLILKLWYLPGIFTFPFTTFYWCRNINVYMYSSFSTCVRGKLVRSWYRVICYRISKSTYTFTRGYR